MPDSDKRPSFIQVNRNFCNYPLARDRHARATWRRSKKTDRLWCELPGEFRVKFRLAAGADRSLRRLPSGFDVAVLLALLRAAHVKNTSFADYASVAALVRDVGIEPAQRHRRAATDALLLWSALGIIHDAWHSPQQQARGRLALRPPISGIEKSPGRLRVKLAAEWRALAHHYFVRVPRKLPTRAPLQNLILWLLTSVSEQQDKARITQKKRRRQLCRVIGVNHSTRNRVLADTIAAAARWFEDQGGSLDHVASGEYVVFIIRDPRHRGARRSTPRARLNRADTAPRPAPTRPREPRAPSPAKAPAAVPIPVQATDDEGRGYTMWRLPSGEYVSALPEGVRDPREPRWRDELDALDAALPDLSAPREK